MISVTRQLPRAKVPAHHVLAHAHPAAGFPVGTALLVAGVLLAGVVAGLLLRLVPRGRRRDKVQSSPAAAADAVPPARPVPSPSYLPEPVMPRQPALPARPVNPVRDDPEPARRGTERITVSLADPQAERDALVQACIRARDMTGGGAVRRILGEALALAGVTEVDPAGQRFDPDVHCSVGVLHTPVPRLDATIASAERVGYDDHGRHLRLPEVIVFASEERP